ncbi:MAG: hypothetical protein GY874_24270, partial [Desulfobacteraceae bacterium]|nr:hypothetical protein [Desulfobacteraceae bacterium]
IKYQKECYQALHDYWHKGEAVNPRSTTHPKPKLKRPQIPPVNKNLLFKYSYDGLTQIKTTHEELETIQKYLSEPEIELICILRSLGSQRRSQTYKLAYRLYKIMHKVRIQMGHRPDLSEREAINYVVDRSLGMA